MKTLTEREINMQVENMSKTDVLLGASGGTLRGSQLLLLNGLPVQSESRSFSRMEELSYHADIICSQPPAGGTLYTRTWACACGE